MLGFGNISKGRNWLKFEDSNVGYTNIALPQGYSMIAPTFEAIGADGYDLSNIVPMGESISGDGDIGVQILDAAGQFVGEYYWLTEDGWGAEKDGWYTLSDEAADVKLAKGSAVLLSCDNEGVSVQVAGQVSVDNTWEINQGYTLSGNATPVAVALQNIVPQGDAISGDGDLCVQFMSPEGQWVGEYYWLTEDGWGAEKDGWYTLSDEAATETLQPGFSFIISSDNEGVSLKLPNVL